MRNWMESSTSEWWYFSTYFIHIYIESFKWCQFKQSKYKLTINQLQIQIWKANNENELSELFYLILLFISFHSVASICDSEILLKNTTRTQDIYRKGHRRKEIKFILLASCHAFNFLLFVTAFKEKHCKRITNFRTQNPTGNCLKLFFIRLLLYPPTEPYTEVLKSPT
jgi:hypothetical protein